MIKKIFLLVVFSATLFLSSSNVFADEVTPGGFCKQDGTSVCCNSATPPCVVDGSFECQPDPTGAAKYPDGSVARQCLRSTVGSVFGKIKPPPAINKFLSTLGTTDPTGATGIGKFLSNLITLIYIFAIIVLIFMLLWGAFDWMLSEGNKEKLQAAQNKIINAIIGILLFAVAFAIIQILGHFTGFTFFVGQK